MKHILFILSFIATVATATTILDSRSNVVNTVNNVITGAVTVVNNSTTTIDSNSITVANTAFDGATFSNTVIASGFSNLNLAVGLAGGITNNVATLDGSNIMLKVNTPTSGIYAVHSVDGVLQWKPIAGFFGRNLFGDFSSSISGVTNTFYASGTNDIVWTWTGDTTNIQIKAWGAGGGASAGTAGAGGFVTVIMTVTNQQHLTLRVPYAGSSSLVAEAYASWPGGGTYDTNSTTHRGGGGGCAIVLHGTNIVLVAGGGGGSANGGAAGSAGWPTGTVGATRSSGAGGQTNGGVKSGYADAGSFLKGGNAYSATSTTATWQACGGCGIYGAGGSATNNTVSAAGGASYYNINYALWGYATFGVNSGDINYGSSFGAAKSNGAIIVITPKP